jgi:hypothetical protein
MQLSYLRLFNFIKKKKPGTFILCISMVSGVGQLIKNNIRRSTNTSPSITVIFTEKTVILPIVLHACESGSLAVRK